MNKITISLVILAILSFLFKNVSAQKFYLPDTAFKNELIWRGYGPCIMGDSIDASCPQIINTTDFYISNDSIASLEGIEAFSNITKLWVYEMPGVSIPNFPDSLTYLDIVNCSGISLNYFPPFLETLSVDFCDLTTLPPLPNTLRILTCINNNLSSLPSLPDSMILLSCSSNPNLTCLPRLNYIESFYFDNCAVVCVPNYGEVLSSSPDIDTFPTCDLFNVNGCDFFWDINGSAFNDFNSDCNFSPNEEGLRNIAVRLYESGNLVQQTYTKGPGSYAFFANAYGNYSIEVDTSSLPFELLCPPNGIILDTLSAIDTISIGNDFAFRCKAGFDLGVWSIVSTRLRAGNQSTVHINAGDFTAFYGYHCLSGLSATLTINLSGQIQYVGPAPGAMVPSSVSGNTITYNIIDIGQVDPDNDFVILVKADTTASIGSEICFSASIAPINGDLNPLNNSLVQCFSVEGSFDPNDKAVYPIGDIDTTEAWLTYTVRFQNTGNAYAENIHIIDTLNSNLDLSTFQLLSTSHPSVVQILDGGIARFNFPNIFLPDSNANEPESHGYVQYKIRPKPNLAIGSQISNTANIYFDFNAPVETNTTLNTVALHVGIADVTYKTIKVWPNPVSGQLHVSAEGDYSIRVRNILGAEVFRYERVKSDLQINVESWTPGIYFVEIIFDNGIEVKRVIRN